MNDLSVPETLSIDYHCSEVATGEEGEIEEDSTSRTITSMTGSPEECAWYSNSHFRNALSNLVEGKTVFEVRK